MKQYVKINVTQEDLKKGLPGIAARCPVARAISRHLNMNTGSLLVGIGVVKFWVHGRWEHSFLPSPVGVYIERIDSTFSPPVQPFSFKLEVPKELILKGIHHKEEEKDDERNKEVERDD